MSLSAVAIDAIRRLVDDLAAGNYAAIEAAGWMGRQTEAQLRQSILDYGRTLVSLPRDGAEIHLYQSNRNPQELFVNVDLWTVEEGRSDLTLQLTVVENGANPQLSIEDLHVL